MRGVGRKSFPYARCAGGSCCALHPEKEVLSSGNGKAELTPCERRAEATFPICAKPKYEFAKPALNSAPTPHGLSVMCVRGGTHLPFELLRMCRAGRPAQFSDAKRMERDYGHFRQGPPGRPLQTPTDLGNEATRDIAAALCRLAGRHVRALPERPRTSTGTCRARTFATIT